MVWVLIAIIAVVLWIIYMRRTAITLTKKQSELIHSLIQKERDVIEKKRQKIIENGAVEGKTVPIEGIFKYVKDSSFISKNKNDLLEKYGSDIPVDVAYGLLKQFEDNED